MAQGLVVPPVTLLRHPMRPCPQCDGRGWLPIVRRETVYHEDGTTEQIECDATSRCWFCGGAKRVPKE